MLLLVVVGVGVVVVVRCEELVLGFPSVGLKDDKECCNVCRTNPTNPTRLSYRLRSHLKIKVLSISTHTCIHICIYIQPALGQSGPPNAYTRFYISHV